MGKKYAKLLAKLWMIIFLNLFCSKHIFISRKKNSKNIPTFCRLKKHVCVCLKSHVPNQMRKYKEEAGEIVKSSHRPL